MRVVHQASPFAGRFVKVRRRRPMIAAPVVLDETETFGGAAGIVDPGDTIEAAGLPQEARERLIERLRQARALPAFQAAQAARGPQGGDA